MISKADLMQVVLLAGEGVVDLQYAEDEIKSNPDSTTGDKLAATSKTLGAMWLQKYILDNCSFIDDGEKLQ